MHRLSEKQGSIPKINLMLIQNPYTFVRTLNALFTTKVRIPTANISANAVCHGYTTAKVLEMHKPECMGQLKRPTRLEMPKEGESKVKFKNHHKQMKAPFVVYADFEYLEGERERGGRGRGGIERERERVQRP